jgi:uncharacterized protein YciI
VSSLWLVRCLDVPGSAERRREHRAAHSERLRSAPLRQVVYGPLTADDGQTAIGSLLIVEADDRAQVEAFVAQDPFTVHEVWGSTDIHMFAPSQNSPTRLI